MATKMTKDEAEALAEAAPPANEPGGNARAWSAEEIAEAKHQKAYRADYGPYPRCEICAEYVEPEMYSQHVNAHMGRGAGALGAGLPDDD